MGHFYPLDPDPDPATQINADPDPKPWFAKNRRQTASSAAEYYQYYHRDSKSNTRLIVYELPIYLGWIHQVAATYTTFSHVGLFQPSLGSVLSWVAPLPFSLVQFSPPPPSLCEYLCILYSRIQCVRRGGYGVQGLRQTNTCRKSPFTDQFFRWRHFALVSIAGTQCRKFAKTKSDDLRSVFPERSSASPWLQESLTVSTPIRILPPLSDILSDSSLQRNSKSETIQVGVHNAAVRSLFTWDAFESRFYFVDEI